ncbi:MAG TPA: proline dehydrogenase family protein [Halobacteriales archaeon]|nr:proline dehydrogenase family protein [Halobacteriales archaeon]
MIPPIAGRFVAGESAVSVLGRARELNGRGIGAICNRLGEHYDSRAPADEDVEAYRRLLAEFRSRGLRACVSVKPTQLGLAVDEGLFRENLERVVDAALWKDDENGDGEGGGSGFVWIDMEGPGTTGATIDAFEVVSRANPGRVGVCLQANLDRTDADVDRLADVPGKVRLVKGAYDPPEGEGVRGADAVNAAYQARLEELFASRDGPDQAVAVGTHDPRMIELARSLGADYGTDFEVQMLMGVREDEQDRLARELDVWQYVPYGERWFAYFSRRVAERKENVLFALRAVLGR